MAKVEDKAENLNDRQMRFVSEYMKDCNGKQAAIRAGYAPRSAEMQASRLLSLDKVKKVLNERQDALRKKDETVSERIRRRLWEESEDFSEFASHSARIRALEVLCRIHGEFIIDNKQKTDGLSDILAGLNGKVLGVTRDVPASEGDDESY